MNGPVDDLKMACQRVVMVFGENAGGVEREFAAMGRVKRDGRTVTVVSERGAAGVVERAEGLGARPVEVQPLSLREMFLEMVKGEAR